MQTYNIYRIYCNLRHINAYGSPHDASPYSTSIYILYHTRVSKGLTGPKLSALLHLLMDSVYPQSFLADCSQPTIALLLDNWDTHGHRHLQVEPKPA